MTARLNDYLDMDMTLRHLEQLAVERRMVFLAAQVKALPGDDFLKAQVLQLIDEVTAFEASGNGTAGPLPADSLSLPAASTAAELAHHR